MDCSLFTALDQRLGANGWRGRWAHKGGGKPDGCATLVQAPWTCREWTVLPLATPGERGPAAGHIALLAMVERPGSPPVLVANAHVRWDAPETRQEEREGLAQGRRLLAYLLDQRCARAACGDFNAEPTSSLLDAFRFGRFLDAHEPEAFTCNAGKHAKKIDYILHSQEWEGSGLPSTTVTDDMRLPSPTEPSDHVPLFAALRSPAWRDRQEMAARANTAPDDRRKAVFSKNQSFERTRLRSLFFWKKTRNKLHWKGRLKPHLAKWERMR